MAAEEPTPDPERCASAPVGTVTFLLTDIEGSTRLWEGHPSEMREALRRHNSILGQGIEDHGGHVVTSRGEGDSFFAVFASAIGAVDAAAAVQLRLSDERWPEDCPIKVRMALHTGEAEFQDREYHGHAAINRCARLRAAAHGGQVLLTRATRDLVVSGLGRGLELRDLGEHRLRDLREAERVYQLVVPATASEFPPILTLADRSNNLPVQTTSFVGRTAELSQAEDLMGRHRLVTLLGAGGSGKTRLALQLAAEVIEHFPDGTWFVELASLTDGNLVAPQVAAALHMGDLDVEKLKAKRLLIVLDNCEHLRRACAEVVALLVQSCPGLSVLATSREPLEVPGEQLMRLPALAPADARELFLERASLVRPDFAQDGSQDRAVAAICARLDGIPLAIELAAARVRSMSTAEILEGLQDRFALLRSRSSLSPERHQSLRAAVTWSYDHLEEAERWLFRHLSVFSGIWSAAAACAVCSRPSSSELEVRDSLGALVDKSLVVASGQARSRYSMLETLHDFAREMLEVDDDDADLRRRHAGYFLELSSAPDWPTETWWLDPRVRDVLIDLDNFRAAIAWSRNAAPGMEIGLVVGAAPLWMASGRYAEGKAALNDALERNREPTALRLRALVHLVWLSAEHGDLETASSTASDALHVAEKLGGQEVATAQSLLGYVALQRGDLVAAEDFLAMSLATFLAADNLAEVARVRHHQAVLAMKDGDPASARSLFDEVVGLGEKTGDAGLVAYALVSAIPLLVDQKSVQEARERWQRAYQCSGGEGPEMLNLALLGYAAWIAAAENRPRRAVALTECGLSLQETTGWQDEWLLEWFWRTLEVAYQALDASSLADARSRGRTMSVQDALAYAASDED